MKSLYLTRIYPSHKIFTQAALVALMTFSMSDNIDNIIDNIDNIIERGPQPPGTIPISLDVVALYPSVPTDRGLVRLREALTNSGMGGNKVGWLCRCMEVILRGNIFKFKDKLYTQRSGTSIESPPAGSYAGLYMVGVEERGTVGETGQGGDHGQGVGQVH